MKAKEYQMSQMLPLFMSGSPDSHHISFPSSKTQLDHLKTFVQRPNVATLLSILDDYPV